MVSRLHETARRVTRVTFRFTHPCAAKRINTNVIDDVLGDLQGKASQGTNAMMEELQRRQNMRYMGTSMTAMKPKPPSYPKRKPGSTADTPATAERRPSLASALVADAAVKASDALALLGKGNRKSIALLHSQQVGRMSMRLSGLPKTGLSAGLPAVLEEAIGLR